MKNGLKDHIDKMKALNDINVEVGWFSSNRYPNGQPVAAVARWQEYGTARITARPFMRLAQKMADRNIAKINAAVTKDVLTKDMSPKQALEKNVGGALKIIIVDSIKNGGWKSNAKSTAKRKGFDKPLIDTALMWKSVSVKVS